MSEEILKPCPICWKMIDVAELFDEEKEKTIVCPDCKANLRAEITKNIKLVRIKKIY